MLCLVSSSIIRYLQHRWMRNSMWMIIDNVRVMWIPSFFEITKWTRKENRLTINRVHGKSPLQGIIKLLFSSDPSDLLRWKPCSMLCEWRDGLWNQSMHQVSDENLFLYSLCCHWLTACVNFTMTMAWPMKLQEHKKKRNQSTHVPEMGICGVDEWKSEIMSIVLTLSNLNSRLRYSLKIIRHLLRKKIFTEKYSFELVFISDYHFIPHHFHSSLRWN